MYRLFRRDWLAWIPLAIGLAGCGELDDAATSQPADDEPQLQSATAAAPLALTPTGTPRSLPARFLGTNLENQYGEGFAWTDAAVETGLTATGMALVRVPGGDAANYTDWHTGEFWLAGSDETYGGPTAPAALDTLGTLVTMRNDLHARVAPLYVLDVMAYANRLLTPSTPAASLTAAQNDQIAMLQAAAAAGLPVQNIELGNEFFWQSHDQHAVYPTGAAYATAMQGWLSAIRAQVSGLQVAAVGALPDLGNWNEQVLAGLEGQINAMALHRYDALIDNGQPAGTTAPQVLAFAFTDWAAIHPSTVDAWAAQGLQTWVTEYNGFSDCTGDEALSGRWLDGLYQAEQLFQFLTSPHVTQIELYNLAGDPQSLYFQSSNQYWDSCAGKSYTFDATPGDLTATGQVIALVSRALGGARQVTDLELGAASFQPIKTRPDGVAVTAYPSAAGAELDGPGVRQWVIANFVATAQTVSDPAIAGASRETLYAPGLGSPVTSNASVTHTTGTIDGTGSTSLEPYSVTRISVPANAFVTSTDLRDAAWWTGDTTVSAPQVAAPDGSATAQTLSEDSVDTQHLLEQQVSLVAGQPYTFSVYVKGSGRQLQLVPYNATDGNLAYAQCDPATGTLISGTGTITAAGAGWYRCAVTFTPSIASNLLQLKLMDGGQWSYAGDGASLSLWGPQLEHGAQVTPYLPTDD